MKKVFLMMVAAALVCASCTKKAAEATEATEEEAIEVVEEEIVAEAPAEVAVEEAAKPLDITGDWTIIRMKEMPIVTPEGVEAPKMSFDGENCHLSFCNEINASYTLAGNVVTFGPCASTKKMGKPEVMAMEKALCALINGSMKATVEGNTLSFTTNDGAPIMTLTK